MPAVREEGVARAQTARLRARREAAASLAAEGRGEVLSLQPVEPDGAEVGLGERQQLGAGELT